MIIAIVALIRGHTRGPSRAGTTTALRVLEERYARGEIPREEFVERRSVLSRQGWAGPDPGEPE